MIILGNLSSGTVDNRPPLDTPVCGFYREKCPKDNSGGKYNNCLHFLDSKHSQQKQTLKS